MTTALDVAAYRSVMSDLSTVAVADVSRVLGAIDLSGDPVRVRDTLIRVVPEVLQPYATASSDVSATWYEDLRSAAVGGSFYATSSAEINREQLSASIRWAVSPLFGQSDSTVLSLLSGTAQRLVADAGRDTVQGNVMRDRVRVGYARIPRPGCCAFCGMLASRGAVYNSQAAADGVVGRGVDAESTAGKAGGQGKGVKARGSQELTGHYHDDCHCVGAPVFTGDTFHQKTQADFAALYDESRVTKGPHGAIDTKATLAAMRQQGGIK